MNDCPELSQIDSHRPSIRDHVVACPSCRIVQDLLAERARALELRDRRAECMRFEMLIAAREDGTIGAAAAELLDAHLRECSACNAVALTLPPRSATSIDPLGLPPIDTSMYALGREVARGGMGRILEAVDLRVGRQVAVKELLDKNPALASRFEREAMVTARLQHPSIVPIYEIGRWPDGTPFYTMRMVDGRTLRDELKARETLEGRMALLPAIISAAEAIAFAHAKRVIHRDLTPNNILVGKYGETVVIDWGLAKDLTKGEDELEAGPYRDKVSGPGLTIAGAVIGTAAYMPPEQARGEAVDERADVYALGAILYHVLAGTSPYRAGGTDEVLTQVIDGPPRSLGEVVPDAPQDLVSIATKAMSREAAARYPNAGAVAEELRRFQSGAVVEAHPYTRSEHARRWVRKHSAGVLASIAALVALATAGTVGVLGVIKQRNRAEREARTAIEQRGLATAATEKARRENAALMTEQGRQELVAGNTTRALAWLNEAYKAGDTSPELRFLLGTAMRHLESIEYTFDCGGHVQSLQFSTDQTKLMAACGFSISIGTVADGKVLMTANVHNNGATLSPDASRIASRRSDQLMMIDAATGAELYSRTAHEGFIRTTAFTPDGRSLITSGDDGKVRIWEASSGRQLHVLDARSGAMNVVRGEVTSDGRTYVTATADGRVIAWDIATGTRKITFQIPRSVIGEERFLTQDGRRMVGCGIDGTVRMFDLANGRELVSFTAHTDAAFSCSLSTDGTRILSTGVHDGTAKIWDVENKRLAMTFVHGGQMLRARLSSDGQRVITYGGMGDLKMWHAGTGSLLASLDDPFGDNKFLMFSGDGRRVVTVRQPFVIVVSRALDAGIEPRALARGSKAIEASPSGKQLAIEDERGALTIVDAATQVRLPHPPMTPPVAWSADHARIVAGSPDGGTQVVDATTGLSIARLPTTKAEFYELDRHGRRMLVGGGAPELWDIDGGRRLVDLKGRARAEALSASGRFAIAWRDPRRIEIWDVDRGVVKRELELERDVMRAIGFDASEQIAILTEADAPTGISPMPFMHRVATFDVATGKRIASFAGRMFTNVDATRTRFISSGLNAKLEIRRATDGTLISALAAGSTTFMAGMTTADGHFAVVNDFGSVAVRSVTDGRVLAQLRPRVIGLRFTQDEVQFGADSFSLSADGKTLVLLGESPVVWRLPEERRSPAEIDRIIGAQIRWRIVDGRLVPVETRLRGRVVKGGEPVPGAQVSVQAPVWSTVTTDGNGRFEFPELRVGKYFVIAMSPDKTAKGIHNVQMTREGVEQDFELDERATLAGVVVDEQGAPVTGVVVRAGLHDGALRAKSDERGNFVITALDAGVHKLVVMKVVDGKPTGFELAGPPVTATLESNVDSVSGVRLVVRRAR